MQHHVTKLLMLHSTSVETRSSAKSLKRTRLQQCLHFNKFKPKANYFCLFQVISSARNPADMLTHRTTDYLTGSRCTLNPITFVHSSIYFPFFFFCNECTSQKSLSCTFPTLSKETKLMHISCFAEINLYAAQHFH